MILLWISSSIRRTAGRLNRERDQVKFAALQLSMAPTRLLLVYATHILVYNMANVNMEGFLITS